jgi:transcriptional regulator with XRE-family HTH domain
LYSSLPADSHGQCTGHFLAWLVKLQKEISKQLLKECSTIYREIMIQTLLNMSQSHLARTIGTRHPAISRLERGDFNNITLSTLIKVAQALDLDLDLDITLKARRPKVRLVARPMSKIQVIKERKRRFPFF